MDSERLNINSLNIYKASSKRDETFSGECLIYVTKAEPPIVLLSGVGLETADDLGFQHPWPVAILPGRGQRARAPPQWPQIPAALLC